MNHFQDEMERETQGFVARITKLALGAALHNLRSALSNELTRPGGAARSGGVSAPAHRDRSKAAALPKRSSADIEELSKRFLSFIDANPGLRIGQISTQLGTTTKELIRPVRRLVADRKISTRHRKRATIYFAAHSLEVVHGQSMASGPNGQDN